MLPSGDWLMTVPAGTVSSNFSRTCGSSPASMTAALAWSTGAPTTFGTATGCGPSLITSTTTWSRLSSVPGAGLVAMTEPSATLLL